MNFYRLEASDALLGHLPRSMPEVLDVPPQALLGELPVNGSRGSVPGFRLGDPTAYGAELVSWAAGGTPLVRFDAASPCQYMLN